MFTIEKDKLYRKSELEKEWTLVQKEETDNYYFKPHWWENIDMILSWGIKFRMFCGSAYSNNPL